MVMKINEDLDGFLWILLESAPSFDDSGIENVDMKKCYVRIDYIANKGLREELHFPNQHLLIDQMEKSCLQYANVLGY
jgi:hypothetical protein